MRFLFPLKVHLGGIFEEDIKKNLKPTYPKMIYNLNIMCSCLPVLLCIVNSKSINRNQKEDIPTHTKIPDRLVKTQSQESEDIDTIFVTHINTEMDGNKLYVRKLHFKSFNTKFELFLRRYSVFRKDVVLAVGSEVISETPTMRRYTPACYRGYVKNCTPSHISVTITETLFEAHIQIGNLTYSVECPNKEKYFHDFKKLLYPMTNCSIHRRLLLNGSVLLHSKRDFQGGFATVFKDVDTIRRQTGSGIRYHTKLGYPTVPLSGNCVLEIIIDHLYFEVIGNSDISRSIAEMVVSVTEADLILRSTDFDGDGAGDNIGLKIGNITIYKRHDDYRMKMDGNDPFAYLNHLAGYDHSKYCLAVAFTYRNFKDKIAGLSWIATSMLHGGFGGICQQYAWGLRGLSTNAMLVSQICLGHRVSATVVGLILAHELGHSMGSPHDDVNNARCSPGGNFGNYVMYPKILHANRANHRRYSNCSINRMYPILVERAPGCFEHDSAPVCGNMVLEDGEECDCGSASTCEDVDPCCTPSDVPSSSSDVPCSVRKSLGYQCSGLTSECCSKKCVFVSSEDRVYCRKETECRKASICETGSPSCPDSPIYSDGKHCDSGRKTCMNGTCAANICDSLGLRQCMCTSTLQDACWTCCIPTNITGVCSRLNTYDTKLSNILKHRGDPCMNYRGFCTELGHCLLNMPDTFDILHHIFHEDTVDHISTWLKKYWYYVLIGLVATAIVAFVLAQCFRQKPDAVTNAIRIGKLSGVISLAEEQKALYRERMDECEALFQAIAQEVKSKPGKKTLTEAVGRLSVLFPTAPKPLIVRTAQSCSSEEVAVKMLLLRNFSIKRFVISPGYENIFDS